MTRALSPALMQSLETGLLAPLAERVRGDHTLYLALRGEGLNLYYRGANLMRVDRARTPHSAYVRHAPHANRTHASCARARRWWTARGATRR